MAIEEGRLTAPDGLSLYWKAWLPEGRPKAVLHDIHGYAEHIDRYGNVVDALLPAGYAVVGADHRGHGRSGGRRAYVNSFQELINDQRQLRDDVIRRKFSEAPTSSSATPWEASLRSTSRSRPRTGSKGSCSPGPGPGRGPISPGP